MSVKSLMHYTVFTTESDLGDEVLNLYYRGINKELTRLTFTQATLGMPIFTICVLYLPTIVYVTVLNISNSRKHLTVAEHTVLFVFPVCTNLYYITPRSKQTRKQNKIEKRPPANKSKNIQRSKSAPEMFTDFSQPPFQTRSRSISNIFVNATDQKYGEPDFSLFHSNLLYAFFFISSIIILVGDMAFQISRHGRVSTITKSVWTIFILNLALWLDFNYHMWKKNPNEEDQRSR